MGKISTYLMMAAIVFLFGVTARPLWGETNTETLETTVSVRNENGQPISGARVTVNAVRSKASPLDYVSLPDPFPSTVTDAAGIAAIQYTKYASEQLETGQVVLTVTCPGYAPAMQVNYSLSRPVPVVLQPSATVLVTVLRDGKPIKERVFLQTKGIVEATSHSWQSSEEFTQPAVEIPHGQYLFRAVYLPESGDPEFSPGVKVKTTTASQAAMTTLTLAKGHVFEGKLSSNVPRPVRDGFVIVSAIEGKFGDGYFNADYFDNITWGDWAEVKPDGSFRIASLPGQQVQLTAQCDGYVSKPGSVGMLSEPQLFRLDAPADVAMERAAVLDVRVVTETSTPIKSAEVGVSANTTWTRAGNGVWGIKGRSADGIIHKDRPSPKLSGPLHATTDATGQGAI